MAEYAVVVATFYEDLAQRLVNGAVEAFAEHDVTPASVHTYEVPGAFELPLAAKWCAESGRFDGVACLGVVIRGETDHYEFVSAEAARGIQDVAHRQRHVVAGVPVGDRKDVEVVDLLTARLEVRERHRHHLAKANDCGVRHGA